MKKLDILFILLLLFSCDYITETEIDLPVPKAVLNGVVCPDSVFSVNISSTYFYSGIQFINDAEVSFYLNNEFKGYLNNSDDRGNYSTPDYVPQEGDKIYLQVDTKKYQTLTSETYIPQKARIIQVDTTMYIEPEESYRIKNKINIDMKVEISKKEKSFYLLALTSCYEYITAKENVWNPAYNHFTVHSTSMSLHPDTYYMGWNIYPLMFYVERVKAEAPYIIFSSDAFDQEIVDISLTVPALELSYYKDDINYTRYLKLHLLSLSSSFYLFLQSKIAQYDNNNQIFNSDIYDITPTFTNVEGGYGLFSSVCEDMYDIRLVPGNSRPTLPFW